MKNTGPNQIDVVVEIQFHAEAARSEHVLASLYVTNDQDFLETFQSHTDVRRGGADERAGLDDLAVAVGEQHVVGPVIEAGRHVAAKRQRLLGHHIEDVVVRDILLEAHVVDAASNRRRTLEQRRFSRAELAIEEEEHRIRARKERVVPDLRLHLVPGKNPHRQARVDWICWRTQSRRRRALAVVSVVRDVRDVFRLACCDRWRPVGRAWRCRRDSGTDQRNDEHRRRCQSLDPPAAIGLDDVAAGVLTVELEEIEKRVHGIHRSAYRCNDALKTW